MLVLMPQIDGETVTVMVQHEREPKEPKLAYLTTASGEESWIPDIAINEMVGRKYQARFTTRWEPYIRRTEDRPEGEAAPTYAQAEMFDDENLQRDHDYARYLERTEERATISTTKLAGDRLTVHYSDDHGVDFDTTGLAGGRAAILGCVQSVQRDFGVTNQDFAKVAVDARPIEIDLDGGDYPAKMRRKGQGARPAALVWIDENGKSEWCRIVESSGFPEFDDLICKGFGTRARWSPALDETGRPIGAPHIQNVTFKIEGPNGR
ncbi:TonB family protein [Sphingomicrobium sp. XHP0235]|uniref:TonB family protein n=1 Tax=Sphingomicrobium aquimarinum TaxID=3133971 RepID=UPI0031FEBED2